jgi:hypothetical protein
MRGGFMMILVAYDGSEQADNAFKKEAIELFKRDWGEYSFTLGYFQEDIEFA